jgi:hypothetical protein
MRRRRTLFVLTLGLALALAATPASAKTTPTTIDLSPQFFFFCCTHPSTTTYTVTDTGAYSTGSLKVTIAGQGADNFRVTKDDCQGKPLAPQASCSFDVTWLVGSDSAPTLTVAGKNASFSAQLYGTAVP